MWYIFIPDMESISAQKLLVRIRELDLTLITPENIASAFDIKNRNTVNKLLQRFFKKSYVYRLDKGKYILKDKVISEFTLANLINSNSYISFESALSYYGILPQFTYSITSATTSKSRSLKVQNQLYEYVSVNPNLFWGFNKDRDFLIATPEKALLDTLYISSRGI